MSNVVSIVDVLEVQIDKMILKLADLETKNVDLINKIEIVQAIHKSQEIAFIDLKNKYNALKSANSFLGSDENKKETKLKINSLVREIDYCIAQLSS